MGPTAIWVNISYSLGRLYMGYGGEMSVRKTVLWGSDTSQGIAGAPDDTTESEFSYLTQSVS